jgi:hypothetical protein
MTDHVELAEQLACFLSSMIHPLISDGQVNSSDCSPCSLFRLGPPAMVLLPDRDFGGENSLGFS